MVSLWCTPCCLHLESWPGYSLVSLISFFNTTYSGGKYSSLLQAVLWEGQHCIAGCVTEGSASIFWAPAPFPNLCASLHFRARRAKDGHYSLCFVFIHVKSLEVCTSFSVVWFDFCVLKVIHSTTRSPAVLLVLGPVLVRSRTEVCSPCLWGSQVAFSRGNKSALFALCFCLLLYKIETHCLFFSEGLEGGGGERLSQAKGGH